MSTHLQIHYHNVFGTIHKLPCLTKNQREYLFKYIWGVLNNKKCHLFRINGVEDHIHILTHIHPTVALSSLVKDIKLASNSFIKKEKLFPMLEGWQ